MILPNNLGINIRRHTLNLHSLRRRAIPNPLILPTHTPEAVGFARYDSTRGGAQSDDRTGGNTSKVYAIRDFCNDAQREIRVIFLADGPITHKCHHFILTVLLPIIL